MLALMAHSATDRDVSRPLEKVLMWGGQKLSMIIDTGSPVSVIPMSVYERHRRRWPALTKTALRLSCFLGPLPVIGKLTMDVKSGTVTVTSTLVVVGCQGPLLCGRRTIEEFSKAGVSLLEAKSAACVNFVQENTQLKALLDEFSQLFDNKLGCCEGPPVKLYIKEGAWPRFCKARNVPYAIVPKSQQRLIAWWKKECFPRSASLNGQRR
uniref:Zinc knuckle domain containing protein n=1 Tax=Rhipicephalus appendiculatus TaxID=34631 RepID=A0A131Z0R6_RHIAP